jgi:hypothetical protein
VKPLAAAPSVEGWKKGPVGAGAVALRLALHVGAAAPSVRGLQPGLQGRMVTEPLHDSPLRRDTL